MKKCTSKVVDTAVAKTKKTFLLVRKPTTPKKNEQTVRTISLNVLNERRKTFKDTKQDEPTAAYVHH